MANNSKEILREQVLDALILDLKKAEERAEKEGWLDADELEKELKMKLRTIFMWLLLVWPYTIFLAL